jgi:putative transcriptional regulator
VEEKNIPFFSKNIPLRRDIKAGDLLIAEPFLNDDNFKRAVILICEHDSKGSFGLKFNQESSLLLADLIEEDLYPDIPVYVGGPVQQNTLHFIHRRADIIEKSVPIGNDVFWAGNFKQTLDLLNKGALKPDDVRFFVGYSGWGAGQLNKELNQDAWISTQANSQWLFDTSAKDLWRTILKGMGGDYRVIANYPNDPSLN